MPLEPPARRSVGSINDTVPESERFKETIEVYAERRFVLFQTPLRLYDFELFEVIEGSKRGVIYHKCCMLYEIKKNSNSDEDLHCTKTI